MVGRLGLALHQYGLWHVDEMPYWLASRYDVGMTDGSTNQPSTVDACLRAARERIDASEASLLLAHVIGRSRTWLHAHGDGRLEQESVERFAELLQRRCEGEPVAYLTGKRGFWQFDLAVNTDTLIPRPETELLVELALARIPSERASDVADLGTGSGAVALSISHERPLANVFACDASKAALDVAESNARTLDLSNVSFHQGDWLQAVGNRQFDLIASNPPYIASGDPHLGQGDLRFEPTAALASGTDGLDAIRRISRDAPSHLRPGGWLLLEHGWKQGAEVRSLLHAAGFSDVTTERDLEDRERVTLGRRGA